MCIMTGMIYGYARVSTDGQSVTAQVEALTAAGAAQVFREVASGAKTDRAQLHRLLKMLDEGDVVMVTRLDRLAQSTRDLLNVLATIAARERRLSRLYALIRPERARFPSFSRLLGGPELYATTSISRRVRSPTMRCNGEQYLESYPAVDVK
jgi:Resolvase, N terminal domain